MAINSNSVPPSDWSIESWNAAAASSFAERLGNADYFAHGSVVIGAAALATVSNARRAKSMDRLMERFGDRRRLFGRRPVAASSKNETTNKDSSISISR